MTETFRSHPMKNLQGIESAADLHSMPEYHHHTVASLSAVSSRTMPVHVALAFVRFADHTSRLVAIMHIARLCCPIATHSLTCSLRFRRID